MSSTQFYLLQVNDALFPIGGYSHSQGLETYIQKGIVHDEATAAQYICNRLRWNLAYTDLLAVRLAYLRAQAGDLDGLMRLEEILAAARLPMEQREGSRKMGSRFAKTVQQLDIRGMEAIFADYVAARARKPMTHSCIYGVFCAALGIRLEDALSHYLYAQTSAMVTNCVKTIPLSQSAGQKLLSNCYPSFQTILSSVQTWTEDDLCLSAPGFDLRGIQHEKLYSRLYMS